MKPFIATVFLVFLFVFRLSAQTENADASLDNEEKGAVFRTTCLAEWTGPELFIEKKGEWKTVEMLEMGLSKPMRFSRNKPIVLVRKTEVEGKEQFVPVLTVPIPDGCVSPLILLENKADGSVQSFVSDLDPKNFPYGSYKLVNFTTVPVGALFGTKRFSLDPGQTELVDLDRDVENRLPIMIVISQGEGGVETIYSNMVMNRPGKRMIMFVHPTKDENGVVRAQVRCLVDYRQ